LFSTLFIAADQNAGSLNGGGFNVRVYLFSLISGLLSPS